VYDGSDEEERSKLEETGTCSFVTRRPGYLRRRSEVRRQEGSGIARPWGKRRGRRQDRLHYQAERYGGNDGSVLCYELVGRLLALNISSVGGGPPGPRGTPSPRSSHSSVRIRHTEGMNIQILVVPYDSGHIRRRMGRGPEHLLEHSIKPVLNRLGHHFRTEEITLAETYSQPRSRPRSYSPTWSRNAFVPAVLRVGSPSCSLGIAVSPSEPSLAAGAKSTGVVWFDAHGEATTPDTTRSGFLDGMGISVLTGQSWKNLATSISGFEVLNGERILLVGSRDLEQAEFELLDRVGVRRLAGSGPRGDGDRPLAAQTDGVYVHLDLDVLDPKEAVANQWVPPGGLTTETIRNFVKETRHHTAIKAVGIASYDPDADRDGRAGRAAASIIESLLREDPS